MTVTISGTSGIVNDATDLNYTGTLTGGTGVVNLGSGQVYKDASGNVGVGQSSPSQKLDVNGNIVTDSYSLGAGNGIFFRKGFETTAQPSITVEDHSGSAPDGLSVNGADGVSFKTGNTERARIDSSGNLLVGQTALNGAGKVEISYDRASQWGMQIRNTTGTTAATTYIEFKYVNSTTGYISSTNGTSTTYNTSSDYRLKEDIAPMTGALAKVAALKPVTYTWKSTGMADEGFIAHELAEVCPSAVTGEKDAVDAEGNPKYQGIDTSFLVATLTAAIQEQQTLITALTARITALEGAAA